MEEQQTQAYKIIDFAQNTALVLESESQLFTAGYKVLRSQNAGSLATCSCAVLDGKPVLVYFTRGFVTLRQFAEESPFDMVCRVLRDLVDALRTIQVNGFLSARNVLLGMETVFVDPASRGVRLLYLPATVPVSGTNDVQAGRLAYDLCRETVGLACGGAADALLYDRSAYDRGDLAVLREAVLKAPQRRAPRAAGAHARSQMPAHGTGGTGGSTRAQQGAVYLLTCQSNRGYTLRISGSRTVLGKSADRADCVVNMSAAVSRAHCELSVLVDGSLCVKDLKSLNGTWVDGRRLEPYTETPLAPGSTLRLADVAFQVQRVG